MSDHVLKVLLALTVVSFLIVSLATAQKAAPSPGQFCDVTELLAASQVAAEDVRRVLEASEARWRAAVAACRP